MINTLKNHVLNCEFLIDRDCTCDGYHTFDELYEHRIVLFILLCKMLKEIADKLIDEGELDVRYNNVWRSKLHSDGSSWGDWFIMGISKSPGQQITYHLPLSKWNDTDFAQTLDKAPEYDGHTSSDVLERLKKL